MTAAPGPPGSPPSPPRSPRPGPDPQGRQRKTSSSLTGSNARWGRKAGQALCPLPLPGTASSALAHTGQESSVCPQMCLYSLPNVGSGSTFPKEGSPASHFLCPGAQQRGDGSGLGQRTQESSRPRLRAAPFVLWSRPWSWGGAAAVPPPQSEAMVEARDRGRSGDQDDSTQRSWPALRTLELLPWRTSPVAGRGPTSPRSNAPVSDPIT